MAKALYLLCALTCLACAILLARAYRRGRVRLLMWSALCFAALTLNNVLLYIDLVLTGPEVDLSLYRHAATLLGLGVMLYGLIWDTE